MAWNGSGRSKRLPANWAAIRAAILKRDKYLCQIKGLGCMRTAKEVDHIQAGDNHRPENLRAVCTHCHALKSSAEGNAARARYRRLRYRRKEQHPGMRTSTH